MDLHLTVLTQFYIHNTNCPSAVLLKNISILQYIGCRNSVRSAVYLLNCHTWSKQTLYIQRFPWNSYFEAFPDLSLILENVFNGVWRMTLITAYCSWICKSHWRSVLVLFLWPFSHKMNMYQQNSCLESYIFFVPLSHKLP